MSAVPTVGVRAGQIGDRAALEAAIRSDATFRVDEIAVALELVDEGLAGSNDYEIRVAELEGAVVGYICFGPTPMTRETYDLYWIVVDASARGRGVAGALIRAMEAALLERGGGNVRVETSETEGYGAARALYTRCDYPVAARLADFYGPGDALVIYYKSLSPSG
jgi:ribosomal protein S18 acetylase RimI-like enzyme